MSADHVARAAARVGAVIGGSLSDDWRTVLDALAAQTERADAAEGECERLRTIVIDGVLSTATAYRLAADAMAAGLAECERLRRMMETMPPWEVSDPPTDNELRAIRLRWAFGPEKYQADADALIAGILSLREQCDGLMVSVDRIATERDAAVAQRGVLAAVLAAVLPYQNTNSHCHERDGIWDSDNGVRAGKPCAKCHAFADAREALGLPRWPSPQYVRGLEATEHRDECGCGGGWR